MTPADSEPTVGAVHCPHCSSPIAASDQFCESCGAAVGDPTVSLPAERGGEVAELVEDIAGDGIGSARTTLLIPAPSEPAPDLPVVRHCASCAGEIDADGYCGTCGVKAARERDHFSETLATWAAGVCDRGLRHHRNEDAMAGAADDRPGTWAALVVCDGVSNSTDSDRASLAAARAARDVLVDARPADAAPDDVTAYWTKALEAAVAAAQDRAADVDVADGSGNPPSCTFVAAVLDGTTLVTGCVGDSRAYWLPDEGPAAQLTEDDSWVSDQVRTGVARAVAEADHRAHAITRWLGVDSPDPTPRCVATSATGAGWLLVCSDGLWNYCSEAAALRDLVQELAAKDPEPLAVAGALVDFANSSGGQDNITAVLARLTSPPPAPSPPDTA